MSSEVNNDLKELWDHFFQTRDESYRDEIIEAYLYLVKYVVTRIYAGFPSHIKMTDLYSYGVYGLIRAVEKFDLSKSRNFKSYAIFMIKASIIDELRRLDWIPRSFYVKSGKMTSAINELRTVLGREPSDDEICEYLGISYNELGCWLDSIRPVILISLQEPMSLFGSTDENAVSFADKIADTKAKSGFDEADKNEFTVILSKLIDSLPDQERMVLILYYYEGFILKAIGEKLGISESRVSQVHTKALFRIKSAMSEFGIKDGMFFKK